VSTTPDPSGISEITPVDIVVRLVNEAATLGTYPEDAELFTEAADEIERLRAENKALRVDLAFTNCRIDDMEATIDRLSVTWELP
jgi:hypothetical protein